MVDKELRSTFFVLARVPVLSTAPVEITGTLPGGKDL